MTTIAPTMINIRLLEPALVVAGAVVAVAAGFASSMTKTAVVRAGTLNVSAL